MTEFYAGLLEGKVRQHDKYQMEFKLDYSPLPSLEYNRYSIELYFFVPKSLLIDRDTYKREEFYDDMASLIRYKTPHISIKELGNFESKTSPLARIKKLLSCYEKSSDLEIVKELKLFGNII
ncbi:MAG: hypothetical protein HY602_02295, partial [Parcubacteria group bacterium]|nr:hypothetical protein [Parcubacteria group bacterium]